LYDVRQCLRNARPDATLADRYVSWRAGLRHRTKRSKGCLSRDGMLHMMFKLGQCAEENWRKLRGFDYLAKVITGVTFKDGIEITTNSQVAA
jgi:putative transposase